MNNSNEASFKDKLLNEKIDMNIIKNTAMDSTSLTVVNNRRQLKSSKYLNYTLSILCLILIGCLIIIILNNIHCFNKLNCLKLNDLKQSNQSTLKELKNDGVEIEKLEFNSKWNNSRLPLQLKPLHYVISLKIDVLNKNFHGNCTIYFKSLHKTTLLVVHSDSNLIFKHNYLPLIINTRQNKTLKVKSTDINKFFSYLIIELESDEFKPTDQYSVHFEDFYSEITNNLKGIYLSSYNTNNGTTKYFIRLKIYDIDFKLIFLKTTSSQSASAIRRKKSISII